MTALLDAALDYAGRLHWPVLPLKPGGKEPLTRAGFKDASTDAATIKRWWKRHPDANVGVAIPQGYLVVDVDDEGAFHVLSENLGPFPTTLEQRTPRGRHLWYSTNGRKIRQRSLCDGVDVRVGGLGYVVVAPSVVGGKSYEWTASPSTEDIAPESGWAFISSNGDGGAPAVSDTILAGTRNNSLTSLAGSMHRRRMSEAAILAALLQENRERCKPPLDRAEVQKIVRSVTRYPTGDPDPSEAVSGEGAGDVRTQRLSALQKILGLTAAGLSIERIVKRGHRDGVFELELSDGRSVVLGKAGEVLKPWVVQEKVLDQISVAPANVKRPDWVPYAQAIAEYAEVVETGTEEDETTSWLVAFLRTKLHYREVFEDSEDELRRRIADQPAEYEETGSIEAAVIGAEALVHLPSMISWMATVRATPRHVSMQTLGQRLSRIGFYDWTLQVRPPEHERIRHRLWRGPRPEGVQRRRIRTPRHED